MNRFALFQFLHPALWLATGLALVSLSPQAPAAQYRFYDYGNGLGNDGYDPVAYFTKNKALKGKAKHTSELGGYTWRFTSARHKQMFDADPDKYLPVFGGHCAFGASKGYLVRGSPQAWTVYKGKLYLNYSIPVRTSWTRSIDRNIARAERHWPRLRDS